MTAYYIMRQLIEHMLYHYRSSNNADFKQLELDDKLYKALRQDSADTDVIAEELKSLNDDVLDHSNTK